MEKNLRPLTRRERLKMEYEQVKEEYESEFAPKLIKNDFIELLIDYEISLKEEEASEKTLIQYMRIANRLVSDYSSNERPLEKVDIIEFKEDLRSSGYQITTINNYITLANRFLYFCEQGHLTVSGVKGQTKNTLEDRIYDHEFKRMYTKAKAIGEIEMHYIIKVLGFTGIRVEELRYFTDKTIHNTTIQVDNKGKIRDIYVPSSLSYELRDYSKTINANGRIFTLTYDQIYNKLKFIAGLCKIKKAKVSPHQFRHYFGFRFVEVHGKSSYTQLSDILGHTSAETTRVYTRGTAADYKKKVEEM